MSTGPFHFHSLDVRPARKEQADDATPEQDTRPAGPWGAWSPPKFGSEAAAADAARPRSRPVRVHPDWLRPPTAPSTARQAVTHGRQAPRTTLAPDEQRALITQVACACGLTNQQLAKIVGVECSTMAGWRTGLYPMTQHAERVVRALLEAPNDDR